MIGVSKNDHSQIETVKMWISKQRWPYVETKPLHGTQRIISKDETGTFIQIQVYINNELEQRIMSFGEDINVLEPYYLREKIKERFQKGYKNYQ